MENYSDKLKQISLSANTVERHTEIIAKDLKKQLLKQTIHFRRFALWLDESTDACTLSQIQDFQ